MNNFKWLDLILRIQDTVPAVISLFIMTIPMGFEMVTAIENKFMSRKKKNVQKSMPSKFLVNVTIIVIICAYIFRGNPDNESLKFLSQMRDWVYKQGTQLDYNIIIVVFLSAALISHFLKLKFREFSIKSLLKKITCINNIIEYVHQYWRERESDSIEKCSEILIKQQQLKEPYFKHDEDCYILKDSYAQVRLLYGLLCWLFWFLASLYVLLGEGIFDREGGGKLVLIAICTIGFYFYECYSYYNGYTWDEYETKFNISTSAEEKEIAVNEKAGEEKETVAKNCILHNVIQTDRSFDIERGRALVKTYNSSDDYHKRCIGKIWADLLNTQPEEIDTDFMSAAILLAEHKSVYFATSFYQDAGPYIFPFLSLELLENKKILIISGDSEESSLKTWMKQGMQSKYGYLEFWDVETIQEGVGTADIGIATMGGMTELVATEFANDFLKYVSVVLLLNPSFFISFQPIMMPLILSKIRCSQEKITYIVCDMNITGMVDLLSDTLKESFIFVKPTAKSATAEHMVLNVDCVDENNPFNCVEMCCANELWQANTILKANHLHKTKIHWYGAQVIPIWDIRWRLGIYDHLSVTQADSKDSNSFLINHLEFYESGCFMGREMRATSFVEDNIYNAYELLRQYGSRGYLKSSTSVFSPEYMMRDFMILDETQKMNPITQIVPRFQHSFENMAIAIAYRLSKGSISEQELEWLLSYYNYDLNWLKDWEELIKNLNHYFNDLIGISEILAVNYIKEKKHDRKVNKSLYYVTASARVAFLNWHKQNIDVICFQDEQLSSKENVLNTMPGGHLYQYYLPKQFLVAAGKYYRIEKIGERKGRREVILSRAAEFCTERRYYRQCRKYIIKDALGCDSQANSKGSGLKILIKKVNITVQTEGYISSKKFQEWSTSDFIETKNIPERNYKVKKIMLIQVKQECACVLAVFLKELFFTLFPNCWQLLSVASYDNKDLRGRVDNISIEGKNLIYIIEDSPLDLGLLDTIEIWFMHILNIFGRYADWLDKDEECSKKWKTSWEELEKTSNRNFDFSMVKDKIC